MKLTNWNQINRQHPGLVEKPVNYSLVDSLGNVHITGEYSLCKYKQGKLFPLVTKIRPNYA